MKFKKTVCVILTLCTAIFFNLTTFGESKNINKIDGCNWMSAVKDDALISELSIPGTHDSATKFVSFAIKSRCQNLNISEQLNGGVRFFDLRLSEYKGKFKLVHNIIDCRKGSGFGAPLLYFEDVIEQYKNFLKNNPKETILVLVNNEGSKEVDFEGIFASYIKKDEGMWFTENRIPKLAEVRGKMVLINRFSDLKNTKFDDKTGGINFTNFPYHAGDGSYESCTLKSFSGSSSGLTYTVEDRYKLSKKDKWEKAVKPTLELEKGKNVLSLCYLSTASGLSPQSNAEYVNGEFVKYSLDKNKSYGVVLFDFYTEDLGKLIYSCNNSVADSSVLILPGSPCEVPKAENGIVKFADWFWQILIKVFG